MKILHRFIQKHTHPFFQLNLLHILNDGYFASFALFLPFIAKDMHISLTDVGLLGTILSSLGFFLALPSGYIAAKIGGLRLLVFGMFFYALGYLATSFSPNYLGLFPAVILAGVGLGIFHPVAFALIAKWSTKETRGRQMGNFTALGEVGRIGIASLVTIIIAAVGWRSTAFLYAIIAIVIGFFFFFFLLKKTEKMTLKEKPALPMRLREIIAQKRFLFVNATSLFDSFASTSLFIFLPFLLLERGTEPAL